jgi:hypothetical protein
MSSTDRNEPGLRVGGWIPPYERDAFPRPQHPDQAGDGLTRPQVRIGHRIVDVPPGRRRAVVLGGAVVTAAAIAGITLAYQVARPAAEQPVSARLPVLGGPVVPFVPVPLGSAPTTVPTGGTPADVPERELGLPVGPGGTGTGGVKPTKSSAAPTSKPPKTTAPTKRPPTSKPPTTAPPFVVGTTIGLEPVNERGYRVRHRNFKARLDRVSSGSSNLDKADSKFVVRAGLANSGCLSFESVNYPGYYLRHWGFELRLQRFDGWSMFNADATFCPVYSQSGARLKSYNYPNRFWAERDSALVVSERGAITFAIKPPM